MIEAFGLKSLDSHEFHAILSSGFGLNRNSDISTRTNDAIALCREEMKAHALRIDDDQRRIDVGILAEMRGVVASEFLQRALIWSSSDLLVIGVADRLFLGKVG